MGTVVYGVDGGLEGGACGVLDLLVFEKVSGVLGGGDGAVVEGEEDGFEEDDDEQDGDQDEGV